MDSPAGPLRLAADAHGLREVHFADAGNTPPSGWERDDRALAPVVAQLREYLAGERCAFDVRLAPVGTPFDRLTWDALRDIPHGTTISYAELARRVGRPGAARAVGRANGRNPIAIIVPCHRVIAADGTLGGYAGGLHVKRLLLDLERRQGRIG